MMAFNRTFEGPFGDERRPIMLLTTNGTDADARDVIFQEDRLPV